jgi:hypothetical protein
MPSRFPSARKSTGATGFGIPEPDDATPVEALVPDELELTVEPLPLVVDAAPVLVVAPSALEPPDPAVLLLVPPVPVPPLAASSVSLLEQASSAETVAPRRSLVTVGRMRAEV